jgi:hypothetical protein
MRTAALPNSNAARARRFRIPRCPGLLGENPGQPGGRCENWKSEAKHKDAFLTPAGRYVDLRKLKRACDGANWSSGGRARLTTEWGPGGHQDRVGGRLLRRPPGLPAGLSQANPSARGAAPQLIKKASLVVLSVLSLGGLGGDLSLSGGRLIGFGLAVVAKLVFQPGNSR